MKINLIKAKSTYFLKLLKMTKTLTKTKTLMQIKVKMETIYTNLKIKSIQLNKIVVFLLVASFHFHLV